MRLQILFDFSIRSLLHSKLRTFLTMLGIIIGLAAIVVMVAIGQGVSKQVHDQIASFGNNLLTIMPAPPSSSGARQSTSSGARITEDDYFAIKQRANYIKAVSPLVQTRAQVIAAGGNWNTIVYGGSSDYLTIRDWPIESGRNFTNAEEKAKAKVCIVGKTIAEELFDGVDPIGSEIRVNKVNLKIIGVLKEKGTNSFGMDQDDLIIVPYTTLIYRLSRFRYIQQILCSAISEDQIDIAQQEIEQIMRASHRLGEEEENNFRIANQADVLEASMNTTRTLTIFLAIVAGISLLVGGIGIMNIMLVSVVERTKEIGLRRAIGARKVDIEQQFLIEALILCLLGGIIGIILGVTIVFLLKFVSTLPLLISINSIIIGFIVSFAVGVFFGYYPAKKASDMNPIDALRYE
ncbi:MAG: ABC transporter permease [Exilispira sp.]|nr:ABC transporter permease [Exilispira sp.]